MDKKSSTTQTATQTSSTEPFTGTTKAWAESAYPYVTSKLNSGSSTIADAFNNNTYGVKTNALQDANYNRAMKLLGNSTLTDIAGGSNLDPSTNPYFQKSLDAQLTTAQKAFGSALDSVNSGSQRNGIAQSSMAQKKQANLMDTYNTNVGNMVNTAYENEYNKRLNEMTAANSILASAGTVGDTYQQSQQASKDASVNNALKAESLDSNTISQLLAYLQMMKNGTVTGTTSGSSSTVQNNGIGGLFGM